MSRASGSTSDAPMSKSIHIRIELTRKEGWAVLEALRSAEFGDPIALSSVCEKIKARLGVLQERYGE